MSINKSKGYVTLKKTNLMFENKLLPQIPKIGVGLIPFVVSPLYAKKWPCLHRVTC